MELQNREKKRKLLITALKKKKETYEKFYLFERTYVRTDKVR